MQIFPSPRPLWSPPEPSMLSNAETSYQHGVNGVKRKPTNTHGNSGSYTGTMPSTINETYRSLPTVGFFYLQSNSATETRMGEQIGDSLNNIANAAVQNNDTVGKLVIANNNLTDSIVSLQAHNLKLSKLAKKLTVGTPEVANLSKYDKLPWDPTD